MGAETIERGAWGGQIEFFLTMVGYAVGLGNVWRFPYLVYENGGGAFLIPYVLMLLTVGLPIFFLELSLGQFASLGPITIWKMMPIFKGIGYGMVGFSWILGLYYNVIIAWSLYFFFASMQDPLPWSTCAGLTRQTIGCIDTDNFSNITRLCAQNNFTSASANLDECPIMQDEIATRPGLQTWRDLRAPSEDFFYSEVLQISDSIDDSGAVVWQLALCLLLSWLIIFIVLLKGVNSLGKVMYVVTVFPYIMLTCMLIRAATLPGASKGIEYYLTPDVDKLADANVWSKAATQIFFSLSTCSGGLIAMASYNKFNNNSLRDALLVPIINCMTSVYAGFAVFAMLGFMAENKGVEIEYVAQQGPGLVFIVYPEALTQFPGPTIWALLFFIMLILLGFSSEFSIVESVFVAIMDEYNQILRKTKNRPIIFRGVLIIVFFLISLPMVTNGGFYLFDVVNEFVGQFPLLFVGLFELVFIQYFYGWSNFNSDLRMMLGRKPKVIMMTYQICWAFITPLLLLMITIFLFVQYEDLGPSAGVKYPTWAQVVGWLIVAFTLIWVPVGAVVQAVRYRGVWPAMVPDPMWGPCESKDRTGCYQDGAAPRHPTGPCAKLFRPTSTGPAPKQTYLDPELERGSHQDLENPAMSDSSILSSSHL